MHGHYLYQHRRVHRLLRRGAAAKWKLNNGKENFPMTETIIVAIITGGMTLMGVLIANSKQQAVMETKLEELAREVREHNNYARRMPVVEEQIKVINHRIADLEAK